ncbi:hypothetical protein BGZ91_004281 [Linnemannia elongata]|nr:hypothetical protein BGZ91_004281 [Linnemannia elongata]
MPDAFESFFNITELVEHLAIYLAIKDVSRLARTCKKMHMRCTPSLFKTLTVDDSNFRLFESAPALRVLSQNSQHVRELNLQLYGLIFYYNCLLTFQDITSRLSDTPPTQPSWLPSPDNHASQLVALPPMTRLSRLTVDVSFSNHRPYKSSSANNPAGILAQLTWLTSLSPCLTSVSLQRVSIADMDGCRRLGDVLAGLHAMKKLNLSIDSEDNMGLAIFSQLFFSCPSSLQHFRFAFHGRGAGEDEGEDLIAEAQRQQPLINLKELSAWGVQHWNSAADIRSLFACCPNINKLTLSGVKGHQEADEIEQFISKQCPRIDSLFFGGIDWYLFEPFPFRIMESLPSQQITELEYAGAFPKDSNFKIEVAFLRHSTTLRTISILGTGILPEALFPTITKECFNLNVLLISRERHLTSHITLDDALQNPWTCTKLTRLTLGISGCELPYQYGRKPYYRRPTPIRLTKVETQHFSRLENLYRQIGSLTALQELDLTMARLYEEDPEDDMNLDDNRINSRSTSFPAMLSIRDTSTNRPGYLHHLSGLKQLKKLCGSVSAETAETVVTMGWSEVRWMDQNWPELRQAYFFEEAISVSEQFRWLQDKRKSEGRDLEGKTLT